MLSKPSLIYSSETPQALGSTKEYKQKFLFKQMVLLCSKENTFLS